ncbi:MAG: hypothetical protein ACYCSR_02125 [Thiomonas sp.]
MLNVFTLQNNRLVRHEIEDADDLAGLDPVWADLDEPESWELAWVEERFGVTVPADALVKTWKSRPASTRKKTAACTCAPTFW